MKKLTFSSFSFLFWSLNSRSVGLEVRSTQVLILTYCLPVVLLNYSTSPNHTLAISAGRIAIPASWGWHGQKGEQVSRALPWDQHSRITQHALLPPRPAIQMPVILMPTPHTGRGFSTLTGLSAPEKASCGKFQASKCPECMRGGWVCLPTIGFFSFSCWRTRGLHAEPFTPVSVSRV